ncbi:DUF2474 family protein [Sphingomonas glacialis]|uniref:DUF2474 domain-containing protein n=1 Tax=Sphingomonas glacialis TaxID=658225 RepID=A0A502G3L5_9SPHN|nr:DUF2474 family protein [Sphingomonas glacialis]TPG56557.1 DUF2474 domain-containing protein [Sphingomonas glacialis]
MASIDKPASASLWRRLLWLIAIWTMSVLCLGIAAEGIRLWIRS